MFTHKLVLGLVATSFVLGGFAAPVFAAKEKPTPERRAEMMIKRLDTNGDNKVSPNEIQAQTAAAFKAFDADSDGQVTRDEIKAKRAAVGAARKEIKAARETAGADKKAIREKIKALGPVMLPGMRPKTFASADTDKNGSLSLAEVNAEATKMFKSRDTNGDGVLDASDFAKKI